MKFGKKLLAVLLVGVLAVAMLCGTVGAVAAPETKETPAKRQEILNLINAARKENDLPALVETAEADAQAARMAALYFSTDDEDAYDAQWLAILNVEVNGRVCAGDCYTIRMKTATTPLHWDLADWNSMELLPYPAWALLQSKDTVEVGIAFEEEGGAVILPYMNKES